MKRRMITTGVLLGGLALAAAACGSGGPSVQARQTGDTTATTTTAPPLATTAPAPTTVSATTAPQPPCTVEALTAAHTAKFGAPSGVLKVQSCAAGWATSATTKGFNPPTFTLYRAEGDHWVALNQSAGKLCEGQGVPKEVAAQIGC